MSVMRTNEERPGVLELDGDRLSNEHEVYSIDLILNIMIQFLSLRERLCVELLTYNVNDPSVPTQIVSHMPKKQPHSLLLRTEK